MTTPVVASKGDVEWDLTIESAGFCCLFFFHDCVECPQADLMWRLGVKNVCLQWFQPVATQFGNPNYPKSLGRLLQVAGGHLEITSKFQSMSTGVSNTCIDSFNGMEWRRNIQPLLDVLAINKLKMTKWRHPNPWILTAWFFGFYILLYNIYIWLRCPHLNFFIPNFEEERLSW